MSDLLDRTFTEPINKTEFYEYIVDFVNYNNILDKRINNIFKISPWLYNYVEKDDLKQDIIIKMFGSINNKFPHLDGIGKLKYFHCCVKNTLADFIRNLTLTTNCIFDDNINTSLIFEEDRANLQLIYDLFLNEKLEYELLLLIEEGYNNKEIMEMLDIGRRTFTKIKNKIKNKLIDNYYGKGD